MEMWNYTPRFYETSSLPGICQERQSGISKNGGAGGRNFPDQSRKGCIFTYRRGPLFGRNQGVFLGGGGGGVPKY